MNYKHMWEEFYKRVSRSKKATFTKGDIMSLMTEFELNLLRKQVDTKEVS